MTVKGGTHSWVLKDPETLPAIFGELLDGPLARVRAATATSTSAVAATAATTASAVAATAATTTAASRRALAGCVCGVLDRSVGGSVGPSGRRKASLVSPCSVTAPRSS